MGDEGRNSPRHQRPHQKREGPTAGHPGVLIPQSPLFLEGSGPASGFAAAPGSEGRRELGWHWCQGSCRSGGRCCHSHCHLELGCQQQRERRAPCPPLLCASASRCLPSRLHCSVPEESRRNAAGAAGTLTSKQGFGTGRKGTWGCWGPEPPELWGHSCCQGQQRAHGTSPTALVTATRLTPTRAARALHPWHTEPRTAKEVSQKIGSRCCQSRAVLRRQHESS